MISSTLSVTLESARKARSQRRIAVEALVLAAVATGAAGQLLLKCALLLITPGKHPPLVFIADNPRAGCLVGIALGLLVYAAGTCFWVKAVSHASISYVYPLSATSYALIALAGHYWFAEPVTPLRWLGIGVITIGVAMLALTSRGAEA